jgi:hypothetical protein
VVTVTPETAEAMDRLYGPIADAGHQLLTRYTAEELHLVTGFLELGRAMQLEQAARIRATPRPQPSLTRLSESR